MARLSKRQAALLKQLLEGGDDDDDDTDDDDYGGPGRLENLNITIDLSDEAAVSRGLGLGLLTQADLGSSGDGDDDEEAPPEKPPKRGGSKAFFPAGDK